MSDLSIESKVEDILRLNLFRKITDGYIKGGLQESYATPDLKHVKSLLDWARDYTYEQTGESFDEWVNALIKVRRATKREIKEAGYSEGWDGDRKREFWVGVEDE